MPQIYELLGYPISDHSAPVVSSRKKAFCPFMNATCDGGGNRFMSEIDLKAHPEMQLFFQDKEKIPSGICSIQISPEKSPWVICPRRLLYMGSKATRSTLMGTTQQKVFSTCKFSENSRIGIWSEVKLKYTGKNATEDSPSFDYTFGYILCELGRTSLKSASHLTNMAEAEAKKRLTSSGYTLALINEEIMVEDFPVGPPIIIEVMTSSTSGGNKRIRSCIPQAFEDCVPGKPHTAPGINYRQVWARMASQMIVKSQAAMAWGGTAIWVLQDLLANYISSSTALDLKHFISDELSEVNILSFSYPNNFTHPEKGKPVELSDSTLFAGPIRPHSETSSTMPSFQDIVLASVCPPKSYLLATLCKKPVSNIIDL